MLYNSQLKQDKMIRITKFCILATLTISLIAINVVPSLAESTTYYKTNANGKQIKVSKIIHRKKKFIKPIEVKIIKSKEAILEDQKIQAELKAKAEIEKAKVEAQRIEEERILQLKAEQERIRIEQEKANADKLKMEEDRILGELQYKAKLEADRLRAEAAIKAEAERIRIENETIANEANKNAQEESIKNQNIPIVNTSEVLYFGTCKELTSRGLGNFKLGQSVNYTSSRDKDHDGIACEM